MFQEDAEHYEHERRLVAIEDDRRRNGIWGAADLVRNDWLPEIHGPGPDCDPED